MIKKIRGKVAGILAALLLGTAVVPGNVIAEDAVLGNTLDSVSDVGDNVETDETETDDMQDNDSKHNSSEQSMQNSNTDLEEEQSDSVAATRELINYVGIGFPYLETPEIGRASCRERV